MRICNNWSSGNKLPSRYCSYFCKQANRQRPDRRQIGKAARKERYSVGLSPLRSSCLWLISYWLLVGWMDSSRVMGPSIQRPRVKGRRLLPMRASLQNPCIQLVCAIFYRNQCLFVCLLGAATKRYSFVCLLVSRRKSPQLPTQRVHLSAVAATLLSLLVCASLAGHARTRCVRLRDCRNKATIEPACDVRRSSSSSGVGASGSSSKIWMREREYKSLVLEGK